MRDLSAPPTGVAPRTRAATTRPTTESIPAYSSDAAPRSPRDVRAPVRAAAHRPVPDMAATLTGTNRTR